MCIEMEGEDDYGEVSDHTINILDQDNGLKWVP